MSKPTAKPSNPCFSSGPCAKRPGFNLDALKSALLGRSHRSKPGKARLKQVIDTTREVLGVPSDYLIGIVPASDTGAVEMAMWSMLGARGVDIYVWESFGADWATDLEKQLKLEDLNIIKADYGKIPDLKHNPKRDVVFNWNGTTSGVRVPDANWIAKDREGLVICDATSAVFAMDVDWQKLDVVTYSWQKVMGGEGAHGMLILSPRAVARLESYKPAWPLPKIFRLTKGGKVNLEIFEGSTINTPSMLCVEDALDGLNWAKSVGGLAGLIARSNSNLKVLEDWVAGSSWIGFLAESKEIRSNTSVCFKITDAAFNAQPIDTQKELLKKIEKMLDDEGVAFDIGAYRDAPAGLRIWAGATVESGDLAILTQWLDWAFVQVTDGLAKAV
jgi:phosphoserine aminotransferase